MTGFPFRFSGTWGRAILTVGHVISRDRPCLNEIPRSEWWCESGMLVIRCHLACTNLGQTA